MSSWMEKFISLCQQKASGKEITHAKSCVEIYGKLEKGFGTFFIFVFSMSQFFIIFSLFLAMSQAVGSNGSGWQRIIKSVSLLLVTFGLGLNIFGFACIMDTAHKSLKGIGHCLQEKKTHIPDEIERGEIMNVIMTIDKAEPLNGKGFFEITRGTLTGMMSVGITYVIILVQFRMSVE